MFEVSILFFTTSLGANLIIIGFDNFHFILEPLSIFLLCDGTCHPIIICCGSIYDSPFHSFVFCFVKGKFPGARDVEFDSEKVSEQGLVTFSKKSTNGPWVEGGLELKPCWKESNFGRFTCELDSC